MTDQDLNVETRDIAASAGLKRLEFRAPDGAAAFELWRDAGAPVFEVGARAPLPSFRAVSEFYDVDGVIFCHNQFSSASYTREARHLRGAETDFITVHFPLRGGAECGVVGDRPHQMAPDRICLQDWAHPYATVAEATEKLGIMIPRDRIVARDRIFERQPTLTWTLDSPQGRLLANAWISLWQSLPQARAEDAPALAAGFLGLLNGLISPTPPERQDPAIVQAMLPAMKRFLDSRLSDPALGAAQLVDGFGCSRATVYRIFEEVGGVQAYIRDQRLARCFRALTEPTAGLELVQRIARRWGFSDPRHFSRLFKKHFGVTPSEVAKTAATSATELVLPGDSPSRNQIIILHDWLQRS